MISKLSRNLSNVFGEQIRHKILVIESDDWGSIRMPSLEVYELLKHKGLSIQGGSERYNKNDTLASTEDFSYLFELLTKFKDQQGKHPVFTAVSLVANPDFKKIKENNFSQYYYEPFHETLKKYGIEDALDLWKEGIKNHLFIPQFHGREHLNVAVWMRALLNNEKETRQAFDYEVWGFNNKHQYGISYQAAFDLEKNSDLEIQNNAIKEGLILFEELHGYKAEFFVPPNGPINNSLERIAGEMGIKYISTSKIQKEAMGEGKIRKHFHYIGQKNRIWSKVFNT